MPLLEDVLGHLPVQIQAVGLPVLFIPAQIQPLEPIEDRIERRLRVAVDIRVVDRRIIVP